MRQLTSHKVNGLNEAITINVLDEPGAGNASLRYDIVLGDDALEGCILDFQNGNPAEVGANGISNEALLAIVEDRLIGFQAGKFACRENALALTKLQEAMFWLQKRTRDRVARGVESTDAK